MAASKSGSSSRPTSTPFIGPCTYAYFIFSHGWKKQNNTNTVSLFSGPTPGPSSPVADGAKASDLFFLFFSSDAIALSWKPIALLPSAELSALLLLPMPGMILLRMS